MLKPKSAFAKQYLLVRSVDVRGLAEVWEAVSTKNNIKSTVALKIFPELFENKINDFTDEVPIPRNLMYSNLLPANHLAIYKNRPYLEMHFCNDGHIGMKLNELNENEIKKCLGQIASALNSLHSGSIIHKYIKPSNILLDEGNFYCYLPDLGLDESLRLKIETSFKTNRTNFSNDEVDLPRSFARVILNSYSAPELFESSLNVSAASDIWALGASLYEIAAGKAPFGYLGGEKQLKSDVLQDLPQKFSNGLNRIIKQCLSKNKEDRPSAYEIVKWIEETAKEKNAIISPKKIIDETSLNNFENKSIYEITERKIQTEENKNESTNDIRGLMIECEDAELLQPQEFNEQKVQVGDYIGPIDNNSEAVNKLKDDEMLQLLELAEQEKVKVEESIDPIDNASEGLNKFEDAEILQPQELAEQETVDNEIVQAIDIIEQTDKYENILTTQDITEQETIVNETIPIIETIEQLKKYDYVEILAFKNLTEQETITSEVHVSSISDAFEPTLDDPLNRQSVEKETIQDKIDDSLINNAVDLIIHNRPINKVFNEKEMLEKNENFHNDRTIYVAPSNNVVHPFIVKLIKHETSTSENDTFSHVNIIDEFLNENITNSQSIESKIPINEKKAFPFSTKIDLSLYSHTTKQSIKEPKPPRSTKSKILILFSVLAAAIIFFLYLKWSTDGPNYDIRPVYEHPITTFDSNRIIKASPKFPVNNPPRKLINVTAAGNHH